MFVSYTKKEIEKYGKMMLTGSLIVFFLFTVYYVTKMPMHILWQENQWLLLSLAGCGLAFAAGVYQGAAEKKGKKILLFVLLLAALFATRLAVQTVMLHTKSYIMGLSGLFGSFLLIAGIHLYTQWRETKKNESK